ncbi:MAG TPA: carboxymuconolactone decarboxylase family protein [Zeimonas sp.]|nr:carboxymuconolactone decarboxylase family protein [Zeimonas sp.]
MQATIDYAKANPQAVAAMRSLESYVRGCDLDAGLLELVRTRASQINGCAYCLDMHTKDARAAGETEQRLYLLSAWREAPCYSPRERAALAWTEALTRIDRGVPENDYRLAREQFTERELVDLSIAVIAINGWNRLAIPFRTPAGTYHRSPARGTRSGDPEQEAQK